MRFNFDGKDPAGCKVGLLDEVHLLCMMMYPFGSDWRGIFKLQGHTYELVQRTIAQGVLEDEVGYAALRKDLLEESEVS